MSDLDRKLHEMMGKQWHREVTEFAVGKREVNVTRCICGVDCDVQAHIIKSNPSYLDPVNYWELLQWCKMQDEWDDFCILHLIGEDTEIQLGSAMDFTEMMTDEARGCEAIANFDWGKK